MNRKITISVVDVSKKTWTFEGLRELHDFLATEAKYWKDQSDKLSEEKKKIHPYINAHGTLTHIVNTIESWDANLKEWDDAALNQQLQNLQRSHINALPNSWVWSGHSYANAFIECNKEYTQETATAFIDLILRQQVTNVNNYYSFVGVMLAYEFINQSSDITKRRNSEKVSLGHLRSKLDETASKLIGEVEAFKKDFDDWDNETKNKWKDWLNASSAEHSTSQDSYKNEHSASQNSYKEEFRTYMDGCRTRISELENTYQEKLRLEKPATYWKKSAKKYGVQGGLWSLALIASLIVGFVYFSDFFKSWLEAKDIGIKLNTIQGIILFGSVLAIYAFLIKTLSRLTFSSFHLMRDSEEREQLTYLYLALNNDNNIDVSSRDIVLQALFSRSETGLLSSESGPTMPGVNEILKSVSRPH